MSNKLIQLPQFSYTSLEFDTIIEDIKTLIQEHPEYNQEWDDFLESNAGRMTVELVSFIIQKMAERVDWISKELFISTATQRQSLINLLKLINHRPDLPKASKVNVTAKLTQWAPPFELPLRERIIGKDINGENISFELIEIAEDGKPNYDYIHTLDTGNATNKITEITNIPFYQGRTVIEDDIYLDGVDNEKIVLGSYPVIENSVRVYSITKGYEMPEVESFISPEAQQPGEDTPKIPYMVEIDAENKVTIKFGASSLVETPTKNERIQVYYRTGGGARTNIVSKGIQTTKSYNTNNKRITLILSNPKPAFGGTDGDDINQEKLIAPIRLRSANKTVTEEDYIQHLEDDSRIMHVKPIGAENEPEELAQDYGYSLPPLDTWLYVTTVKNDWTSYDPHEYNSVFEIQYPYDKWQVLDYEDITITSDNQTAILNKYSKYKGYGILINLYETELNDLSISSFTQDIDYTLDSIGRFTRIVTTQGGSIPSGNRTLRVRYVSNSDKNLFESKTIKTFDSFGKISFGGDMLYPNHDIKIYDKTYTQQYIQDDDYKINYKSNTIELLANTSIPSESTVLIYYADNWRTGDDDNSEEKMILDIIKNKKMICVDNHVKKSEYVTFDVSATVHCYKNMRTNVVQNLEPYIRSLYSLNNRTYDKPILAADIISEIMNFDGVRFVQIEYLGTDYSLYRRFVLNELDESVLRDLGAQNYNTETEQEIPAKYNRIYILSNDKYDGIETVQNKIHGLVFKYKDYN